MHKETSDVGATAFPSLWPAVAGQWEIDSRRKAPMSHRHLWSATATMMLSLPDRDHCYDVFFGWRCHLCGEQCHATAYLHEDARTLDPAEWMRLLSRERARATPLAYAAQNQARTKVR